MFRNLEAELKRKGITRKDLSVHLGINITTISAKLSGKRKLSFDEAASIANLLGGQTDLLYLFDKN